jgi:hypothetical protein
MNVNMNNALLEHSIIIAAVGFALGVVATLWIIALCEDDSDV